MNNISYVLHVRASVYANEIMCFYVIIQSIFPDTVLISYRIVSIERTTCSCKNIPLPSVSSHPAIVRVVVRVRPCWDYKLEHLPCREG